MPATRLQGGGGGIYMVNGAPVPCGLLRKLNPAVELSKTKAMRRVNALAMPNHAAVRVKREKAQTVAYICTIDKKKTHARPQAYADQRPWRARGQLTPSAQSRQSCGARQIAARGRRKERAPTPKPLHVGSTTVATYLGPTETRGKENNGLPHPRPRV